MSITSPRSDWLISWLRSLLLVVVIGGFCLVVGRSFFLQQPCHVDDLVQTFRGPFQDCIIADGEVKIGLAGTHRKGLRYVEIELLASSRPLVDLGIAAYFQDGTGALAGKGTVSAIKPTPIREDAWGKPSLVYPTRIAITSFRGTPRDGMKVQVRIPVQKENGALQVPVHAVRGVGNHWFVVVKRQRKLEPRRIFVRAHNTKNVVIDEALSDSLPEGSWVIGHQPNNLRDPMNRLLRETIKQGMRGNDSFMPICSVCRRRLSAHFRVPQQ